MTDQSRDHEIARIKAEAEVELRRLEAQSPAKEIAVGATPDTVHLFDPASGRSLRRG